MQNPRLQIHLCVVLWGFTAIFGRLISLPAIALVEWRMLVVAAVLVAWPRVRGGIAGLSPRLRLVYVGIGALVALHWLLFYGSVKLANASVAATCLGLAPVFLALLEPWVVGRSFQVRELALGVAVVPGVALVVGGIAVEKRAGVGVGVASAFFAAFFNALNKRWIADAHPVSIACIEIGAGAALLPIAAVVLPGGGGILRAPGIRDTVLLLALAVVCTLIPFTLSLFALRRISAYEVQLAVTLEPVYAVVLAALLLGEQRELGARFYAGVALVVGAVALYPVLTRRAQPIDRSGLPDAQRR